MSTLFAVAAAVGAFVAVSAAVCYGEQRRGEHDAASGGIVDPDRYPTASRFDSTVTRSA